MVLFGTAGKGTYWRAVHLARVLAQRGHQISVLSTSKHHRLRVETQNDIQNGVILVETPGMLWEALRSGWDLWNVVARIKWVRNQPFDLVHSFESRPASIIPALYLHHRQGARLILDWCDWFGRGGSVEERPNRLVRAVLRPVETFFENRFRTSADGTTVINSLLHQRAIELGVPKVTILRLPNGSDVDKLHPIPRTVARRALGWPEDVFIIGYIGSIFWRDAELMAEAFNRIYNAEPKVRLLLIGYFNVAIGDLIDAPEAVWRSGHIRYDEINHYLAACDICWLPLQNSGANRGRFPLKINDYMAVGRPVVVTAVGEIAGLVRRGQFGLVASPQPDDLANKVLMLLREPVRCEEMGQRARKMAETEFTWEQIGCRLEEFYQKVLED